jgi:uncharacterized lipoprotein
MKAKFFVLAYLIGGGLLQGCLNNHASRYNDNSNLERPPEVIVTKEDAEIAAANHLEEPRHRHGKGLKADVYRIEGSDVRVRIKRPNNEAWSLIQQAIQRLELKVADEDRSRGVFYVVYRGGLLSWFGGDEKKQTYLLKLEESLDGETEFAVTKTAREEDVTANSQDGVNDSEDDSASLTERLFDALHEEVMED